MIPRESKASSKTLSASTIAIILALLILSGGVGYWLFRPGNRPAPTDLAETGQAADQEAVRPNNAPPGELLVQVGAPGARISAFQAGVMLEEINHSLDGGLYAELLRNRDFTQVPDASGPLPYWSLVKPADVQAAMLADPNEPVTDTAASTSVALTIDALAAGQRAGVANAGYWGIPVKANWTYRASFYAKAGTDFSGPLTVCVESNDGKQVFAQSTVTGITQAWKRYEVTLKTGKVETSTTNRFVIAASSKGTLWLGETSLFPPTYHDRPNGNRIDLMEKLAAMKPSFVRFPGGDYLLGTNITTRFDWKRTIGPRDNRTAQESRWHRSTNGFGLLEFLQTCEDLQAPPVLGIYAGTSLAQRFGAGAALEPYVTDALEELEYVMGDTTTQWGKQRAADGHPDPFTLHYVQISNNEELFGQATYDARFAQFYDAIKAKYPQLKLIGWMDLATTRKPDVIHQSYYRSANDLMEQSDGHYGAYARDGRVYAAEFSAREGDPTKTLNAALADTAWLLDMEKNADITLMGATAPLFMNINAGAAQHPADLIGYDAATSFGSPAYHAQVLLSRNHGDRVLPIKLQPQDLPPTDLPVPRGSIGVGTWGSDAQFQDIKVTAPDGKVLFSSDFTKGTEGWRLGTGTWKVEDGSLRQTSNLVACRAMVGDPTWTDYTLTLKARKNGGAEGFLILFRAPDDGNYIWWNIGGWNNTRQALEQTVDGTKLPVGNQITARVETGKWYDLRVEVHGSDIACFLDDAPAVKGTQIAPSGPKMQMYATASLDEKTGQVILKVINRMPMDEVLQVNLDAPIKAQQCELWVMSGKPGDVNTLEAPEHIVPRKSVLRIPGPKFAHAFPANSVSILRVQK